MHNSAVQTIIVFIIICTILILILVSFVTFIIYRYQQKQNRYNKDLEKLKAIHENDILQSQIEMQELTFQNISQEIHDNIGQKLTLAKLHLNTLDINYHDNANAKIADVVKIIGESINDLSDISRSMSSEIILNNGFIKALEFEVEQLNKAGLYNIKLSITGEEKFLKEKKELLLFRIVQEALNNIVKHAEASSIHIGLHYNRSMLSLKISDNGKGFDIETQDKPGAGLNNMTRRANSLKGTCFVHSKMHEGTTINIEIPIL